MRSLSFTVLTIIILSCSLFISSCEDDQANKLADLDLKEYFFSNACNDSLITEVNVIRFDIATGKPSDTSTVYYVYTCNEPDPGFYIVGVHELYYNFLPKSFSSMELFDHYGRISMKMDFYYPPNENVQNIEVPMHSDTLYYGGNSEYVSNYSFTRKIEMDGDLDDMEDLKCDVKSTFVDFEDITFKGKTYEAIVLEEKCVYETYLRGTIVEADRSVNKVYYAKGLGLVKGSADFWKTPDMEMKLIAVYTPEEFEKKKQVFFSNPY